MWALLPQTRRNIAHHYLIEGGGFLDRVHVLNCLPRGGWDC